MIAIFETLEHLPYGAVLYHTDQKVIYGNRWMTDEFKIDFTQWIGKSVMEQPAIDWWGKIPSEVVKSALQDKSPRSLAEKQTDLKNGFLLTTGHINKGSARFGVLLIEKKGSENAKASLEQFPVSTLVIDLKTTAILEANNKASELFGFPKKELIDRPLFELMEPTEATPFLIQLKSTLDSGSFLVSQHQANFLNVYHQNFQVDQYGHRVLYQEKEALMLHLYAVEKTAEVTSSAQPAKGKKNNKLRELLLEIATQLIDLDYETATQQIEGALKTVAVHLDLDLIRVALFNQELTESTVAFEYASSTIAAGNHYKKVSNKEFPWWLDHMVHQKTIAIENIAALPPEAKAEKEAFSFFGVTSFMSAPLAFQGNLLGYVTFIKTGNETKWPAEKIKLLEFFTKILSTTTHRFQSNDISRQTLNQYQLLANNITDVVSLHHTNSELLYVTPSVKKLLGYTHHELVGTELFKLVHPDDLGQIKHQYKFCLLGREIKFNARYLHKNGSYTWLETTARSIVNPLDEKGPQIVSVSRSVEERKSYEEQLRSREQRMRSLVESQTHYLLRTDTDFNITYSNQRFNLKVGRPATEVLYHSILRFIPTSDHQFFVEAVEKCGKPNQKTEVSHFRLINNDGHEFYTEWEAIAIKNDGTTTEYQWTGKDITEQVLTQEKLRDNLNLLAQVFDQSSDALFVVEKESHKIVDCNMQAVKMFEANSKETLIGKSGNSFELDDRFRNADIHFLNALVEKGKVIQREAKYITFKGNIFWGSLAATSFTFNGKPVVLARVTDISEKKAAEERAVNLVQQMFMLNQQLETQNKELNKTNEALDRFVYSVSHDLRAPINSSLGVIELCMGESDADSIKKLLELQQKSLLRLDKFIKDILDFSRNTRMEVRIETVNLHQFFEGLLESYQHVPEWNHIKRSFTIVGENELETDARRLLVIFNNLITNAFRYQSPYKENPWVEISAQNQAEACIFTVTDNGMGIPNEHLQNIFKMFFRANDRTEGSGLGLYIVQESVEKLNGKIEVNSKLGDGSQFVFTLPKTAAVTK